MVFGVVGTPKGWDSCANFVVAVGTIPRSNAVTKAKQRRNDTRESAVKLSLRLFYCTRVCYFCAPTEIKWRCWKPNCAFTAIPLRSTTCLSQCSVMARTLCTLEMRAAAWRFMWYFSRLSARVCEKPILTYLARKRIKRDGGKCFIQVLKLIKKNSIILNIMNFKTIHVQTINLVVLYWTYFPNEKR